MASSRTSPLMAALASLIVPGAGQLYAGRYARGAAVFAANYVCQAAAFALGVRISPVLGPSAAYAGVFLLHGAAAWDAWRVAAETAAAEAAEPPPPAPPPGWRAIWVLIRLPWILGILGYFLLNFSLLSFASPNAGLVVRLAGHLVNAAVFLGLAGFASAHTFLVASGRRLYPLSTLQSEITLSLVIYGIIGVMLAIVWPMFSDLYRRSGEAAMKGRLGTIREEAKIFETKHGRPPASLDELVAEKRPDAPYPLVTELWPTKSNPRHKRADTGFVLLPDRSGSDSGLWALDAGTTTFFIDCTHTDSRGSVWTAY